MSWLIERRRKKDFHFQSFFISFSFAWVAAVDVVVAVVGVSGVCDVAVQVLLVVALTVEASLRRFDYARKCARRGRWILRRDLWPRIRRWRSQSRISRRRFLYGRKRRREPYAAYCAPRRQSRRDWRRYRRLGAYDWSPSTICGYAPIAIAPCCVDGRRGARKRRKVNRVFRPDDASVMERRWCDYSV